MSIVHPTQDAYFVSVIAILYRMGHLREAVFRNVQGVASPINLL